MRWSEASTPNTRKGSTQLQNVMAAITRDQAVMHSLCWSMRVSNSNIFLTEFRSRTQAVCNSSHRTLKEKLGLPWLIKMMMIFLQFGRKRGSTPFNQNLSLWGWGNKQTLLNVVSLDRFRTALTQKYTYAHTLTHIYTLFFLLSYSLYWGTETSTKNGSFDARALISLHGCGHYF